MITGDICNVYKDTLKKLIEEGNKWDNHIDIDKVQLLTKQLDHAVQACIKKQKEQETLSYKIFGK